MIRTALGTFFANTRAVSQRKTAGFATADHHIRHELGKMLALGRGLALAFNKRSMSDSDSANANNDVGYPTS